MQMFSQLTTINFELKKIAKRTNNFEPYLYPQMRVLDCIQELHPVLSIVLSFSIGYEGKYNF